MDNFKPGDQVTITRGIYRGGVGEIVTVTPDPSDNGEDIIKIRLPMGASGMLVVLKPDQLKAIA